MISKNRTYTWNTSIPVGGQTLEEKTVPSNIYNDCDIVINLISGTSYSFNIIIERANPIAVSADILLTLTNVHEDRKSLTDWGVSPCIFSDWGLPENWPYEKSYNFICQIIWMTTDPIPRPHINSNHIKKFLMSSSYCDVKIMIGKEELPAHKVVLASHSNVFDAMLSAPMKEAAENKIIVEDIRVDVMKTVLAFLYAGEEEALDDRQMALGCLEAAEKYEIQDLKELCEYKLCKSITTESVVAILSDADTFGAERLKKECLVFIAENKAEIIPTNGFQEMCAAKPHLMVQFMEPLKIDP